MRSIKERSVSDEEMGMFWRDTELSFWWYRAPIETQAMMIEAFDEVMDDQKAVEDCKVWLLKQKQTQDWKTTKATADAVYALLLRGSNLLASDELVEVSLGGKTIKPEKVEAGTGFYEQKFVRGEIKPAMGNDHREEDRPGVAWGSVHWQYLEDISKVTAYEGTPLKLTKTLYTRQYTKKGPVLEAGQGTGQGGRRTRGADRAADRPRHGVRPPEGPSRQRHGAGQRAVAIQVPGRPGLLRDDPRHGQPFLHRLSAQGHVCLRICHARACIAASTRPALPRSSACTPRSSTATPRACGSRRSKREKFEIRNSKSETSPNFKEGKGMKKPNGNAVRAF